MAPNTCKLFCLFLFLAFVTAHGREICHLSDIIVTQSKTGKLIQNKPEWEVRVKNSCVYCPFEHTTLSCVGFKSVVHIPSTDMAYSDDKCFIKLGLYLNANEEHVFKYVWDTSFDMKLIEGDFVSCGGSP